MKPEKVELGKKVRVRTKIRIRVDSWVFGTPVTRLPGGARILFDDKPSGPCKDRAYDDLMPLSSEDISADIAGDVIQAHTPIADDWPPFSPVPPSGPPAQLDTSMLITSIDSPHGTGENL